MDQLQHLSFSEFLPSSALLIYSTCFDLGRFSTISYSYFTSSSGARLIRRTTLRTGISSYYSSSE